MLVPKVEWDVVKTVVVAPVLSSNVVVSEIPREEVTTPGVDIGSPFSPSGSRPHPPPKTPSPVSFPGTPGKSTPKSD